MLIYCGDSHARPFENNIFEHKERNPILKETLLVWRPGATAGGFARDKTRRRLKEAFVVALDKTKATHACFNLGQVDVDVGYYYTCMTKPAPSFEDWVAERYESYISFCRSFDLHVVIKGLNPSCLISDQRIQSYVRRNTIKSFKTKAEYRDAYANAVHLMTKQSHAERNVRANVILRDICTRTRLPFFDIRAFSSDAHCPGLVRSDLVAPRLDVHICDSVATRRAYYDGLVSALNADRHLDQNHETA